MFQPGYHTFNKLQPKCIYQYQIAKIRNFLDNIKYYICTHKLQNVMMHMVRTEY